MSRSVVLQAQEVDKTFIDRRKRTATEALKHVSFEVYEEEFFCLLGPSGCGKSTLLNIVAGFESLTGGKMLLNGATIKEPGPDRGIVFQQAALYPWMTVLENVNFGQFLRLRKKRESDLVLAKQFIDRVGLNGFESHKPYELSGGMQQRVAIARALINHPQMLLMDEPFGALDAQTRKEMQNFLLQLWQQIKSTVLFITHDIDEAILLGDRLAVMSARPGRIAEFISVDIPRPRTYESTTTNEFIEIKRRILDLLNLDH